mmetsp:Transcript_4855/g.10619  ORF Transcript_4855/g.10619 Transcript_4855/m.10619 type:complete len:1243 (+) Transcript_4855:157-3885(+)
MEPDPEKLGDGRTPTDAHQDLSEAVPHNPPPSSFDDSAQRQAMKASNIFAKTASDVGADAMPKFSGNSAQILLKVKAKARQQRMRNRYIINPDLPNKVAFDLTIGLFVIYSVLVVPLRIPFGYQLEWYSPLWCIEATMDFCFLMDICLSFFTAFMEDDHLVFNHNKIIRRYCFSWFVPDLLSTITIPIEMAIGRGGHTDILKILRMLRMVKLLRLVKLASKMSSLNLTEYLNPALLRLLQLMLKILLIAHFIACAWLFITKMEEGQCQEDKLTDSIGDWQTCGWKGNQYSQYLAAFYWAIATMMAVGYGDISAVNSDERLFAIATQLVGAICFGFIIATVSVILETFDPCGTAKRERLEEMMRYAHEKQLTVDLQRRMRRHVNYTFTLITVFKEKSVMQFLPDHVRWKLIFFTRHRAFHSLTISRKLDVRLVMTLAQALRPAQAAANDVIVYHNDVAEDCYFVLKGTFLATRVEKNIPTLVGVYRVGSDFELDAVTNCKPVTATYTAVTAGEVMWLTQKELWKAVGQHPSSAEGLKELCANNERMLEEVDESASQKWNDLQTKEVLILCDRLVSLRELAENMPDLLTGNYTDADKKESMLTTWRLKPADSGGFSTPLARFARQLCGVSINADDEDVISESRESSRAMLKRGILDPTHDLKVAWDAYIGVWTILSIFMIPLNIAFEFGMPASVKMLGYAADGFFILDILVNFRTAYLNENGVYDTIPARIAKRYCSTWFAVDLASSLPWMHILGEGESGSDDGIVDDAGGGDSSGSGASLIKLVRLIRLLKLVRLLKLTRLAIPEVIQDLDISVKKAFKISGILAFVAHMIGCLWKAWKPLVATDDDGMEWWYERSGSPWDGSESEGVRNTAFTYMSAVNATRPFQFWAEDDKTGKYNWEQYFAGLYWAFTTMTTVGYGDILPRNDVERLYAIVIMLTGATVFGYIVGSVSTLANDPNGTTAKTNRYMKKVSSYLSEQEIDRDMRDEIRRAVRYAMKRKTLFNEVEILNMLPQTMRQETILQSNRELINQIFIFRRMSGTHGQNLISYLLQRMRPYYFAPDQTVFDWRNGADGVYFVVSGEMTIEQNVAELLLENGEVNKVVAENSDPDETNVLVATLKPGRLFGHENLVGDDEMPYSIYRASTYCSTHVLLASVVAEIAETQPSIIAYLQTAIRRAATEQDSAMEPQIAKYKLELDIVKGRLRGEASAARALFQFRKKKTVTPGAPHAGNGMMGQGAKIAPS